jgi:hypothetical protein
MEKKFTLITPRSEGVTSLIYGIHMEHMHIHIDKYWGKVHTLSCVMNICVSVMNLKFIDWNPYQ